MRSKAVKKQKKTSNQSSSVFLPLAAIALAAPPDSSTVCRRRLHASLTRAPSGKAVTLESRNERGPPPLELLLFGEESASAGEEEEEDSAEVDAEAIEAPGIDATRSSTPLLRRPASLGICARWRGTCGRALAGEKKGILKKERTSQCALLFLSSPFFGLSKKTQNEKREEKFHMKGKNLREKIHHHHHLLSLSLSLFLSLSFSLSLSLSLSPSLSLSLFPFTVSLLHQLRSSGSGHSSELGSVLGDRERALRHRRAGGRGDVDTRAALVGAAERERGDDGREANEAGGHGVDGGGLGVGGVVPRGAGDVLLRLLRVFLIFKFLFFFPSERQLKKRCSLFPSLSRSNDNDHQLSLLTSTAKMLDWPAESSSV